MKKSTRPSRGLWLLICTLVVIGSCKKDKHNDTPKTKTDLLTSGTWKYTGAIITPAYDYYGDGNAVTDIFSIMKTCEKDDFETYKTNGTWEYNDGPTKCDASDPQAFNLPWSLSTDETKLILGGGENIILELTTTALKLRYTFDDSGVTYTEEDSYEH